MLQLFQTSTNVTRVPIAVTLTRSASTTRARTSAFSFVLVALCAPPADSVKVGHVVPVVLVCKYLGVLRPVNQYSNTRVAVLVSLFFFFFVSGGGFLFLFVWLLLGFWGFFSFFSFSLSFWGVGWGGGREPLYSLFLKKKKKKRISCDMEPFCADLGRDGFSSSLSTLGVIILLCL